MSTLTSRRGPAVRSVLVQNRIVLARPECHTAGMERFRCAGCGNALSIPVRLVALPAQPHWSRLDHHQVNPPLLDPCTYAIDEAAYGEDQVAGTFVLSPGDVRGTRIVHDLVLTGCWSLAGWNRSVACDGCGALVTSRTDDCRVAQETRLYPSVVVRETCAVEAEHSTDPFALITKWNNTAPDARLYDWTPALIRPRSDLTTTRWRTRRIKEDLYRDDPPT
jgi:hypothetical protein